MEKHLQSTNKPQEFPNFVIFKIDNAKVYVNVLFKDETLWITQKKMAELFETTPQNITLHLKNIYKEEELNENATCKEFLQVKKEGKISALQAKLKAEAEYEKYRVEEDKMYLSDFDKLVIEMRKKP